jgi:hypothetical protein
MALIIAVAMNDTLKVLPTEMPAALISQQTMIADKANIPVNAEWSQLETTQNAIGIEYPTDWALDVESGQGIKITGPSTGFSLLWSTHQSEEFITEIIAFSETDPNFVDNYISSR